MIQLCPFLVARRRQASRSGPAAGAPTTVLDQVGSVSQAMGTGFAGLHCELTAMRKEMASIMSNVQRGTSIKIDNTAVLTERLMEMLVAQRRALAAKTHHLVTAAAADPERQPALLRQLMASLWALRIQG